MNIQQVELNKFTNYGKTPKFDALEASLLKYGFLSPVIFTADMKPIDGVNRVATVLNSSKLQEIYQTIPTIIFDVDEDERSRLIGLIYENRLMPKQI